MAEFFRADKKCDRALLAAVLVITVLGMVYLYSTGAYYGQARFHDSAYYFKKQLLAVSLGLAVMAGVSCVDYHLVIRYAGLIYFLSLILSTAVLFIGQEYNGSKRWLALGPLSFQPSELAKIAVILLLAGVISRQGNKKTGLLFAVRIFLYVLPIVALVATNNLSTAIIILGIAACLIFMSNPYYMQFVGLGGAAVVLAGAFLAAESYRLERIAVWLDPENYDKGFQTIQGLYAIGSGGLFGAGLGGSMQKLGFVPEAQNDMIFSIVCEETGFFGAVFLLGVFGFLLWRLMLMSVKAPDLKGSLICAGIMIHIALQVLLNVAVVTNSIPNTGITLPFISYGGTSVVFLHGEMGIALNISRQMVHRSP